MPDTITATELKWDCGVSLLIDPDGTYAVCEPNANPRRYSRTIPGDRIAKQALDAVDFYERRRQRRERRGRRR